MLGELVPKISHSSRKGRLRNHCPMRSHALSTLDEPDQSDEVITV